VRRVRAGGRCDDGAVERVSVVGNSGSGKTALARRLAALIGAPSVELDGHRHQAGWTELPDDDLRARVAELCAGDRWVVDGNYDAVRDLVWARADTVVWIDLPRWRVTARVVRRSAWRLATRTELWNGNREHLRAVLSRDPARSPVVASFVGHPGLRRCYAAARLDPAHRHLRFVRLTTPAAVRRFLAVTAAGRRT